jgi:hypothetical protein
MKGGTIYSKVKSQFSLSAEGPVMAGLRTVRTLHEGDMRTVDLSDLWLIIRESFWRAPCFIFQTSSYILWNIFGNPEFELLNSPL